MDGRIDHVRRVTPPPPPPPPPRRLSAGAPWGRGPAILHLDIDAFFASIEQQRNPRLQGRPVVVGTGVVASASYEARARGVKAAMSLRDAQRICPQLVVLPGQAAVYRAFSERIFGLAAELSPDVETYLDDAYIDLTGTECLHGHLIRAADGLRRRIQAETGLTVALGLASNRMVARMVTRLAKPGGLAWLRPGGEAQFVASRPIEDLLGIGHRRAALLREMGIQRVSDLLELTPYHLRDLFGDTGLLIAARARGRETKAVHAREVPKSIRRETSFDEAVTDTAELEGMLHYLAERATGQARKLGIEPRRLRVHIHWSDGKSSAQAERIAGSGCITERLYGSAREILRTIGDRRMGARNIGVELSNFRLTSRQQTSLFDDEDVLPTVDVATNRYRQSAAAMADFSTARPQPAGVTESGRVLARQKRLDSTVDEIRERFGFTSLLRGRSLELMGRMKMDKNGFILRTPCLTR